MGFDTTMQILKTFEEHPITGTIITTLLIGLIVLFYYIDKKQTQKRKW